ICKADLLLKGEGDAADNIVGGPEHSTLSNDAFPSREFDFMLSNPPYGKGWKTDLERMGGKKDMRDPRFVVEHAGDPEYSLITRSSDGQLLFLANKLSKMKKDTRLGSRLAEVHNGSSLFTGDAGQGESNIRRWIIENDWLEAIVALPLNLFYNTGIATYVWVLTNHKPAMRRGKVQLIDATGWHQPLRKSLGKKNCELGEDDIERICRAFLDFEDTEQSRIFDNDAFGYSKVTVERPLRIQGVDPQRAYKASEIKELREHGTRSENAPPVIRRVHKRATEADPLRGLFPITLKGGPAVVEYEPDADLRDTEQVPLQERGGIDTFLRREVLPYATDAWYQPAAVKIGYEISFNRYFYKPEPLRSLDVIRADILALEKETDGLLDDVLMVRDSRAGYVVKPRVYVDTSVIGGCEDDEFRDDSRRLFERFKDGGATLILSALTLRELETAPDQVRAVLDQVPTENRETVADLGESASLAQAYIDAGAVAPSSRADAVHVALATLCGADVLVSWNFRHMVNWQRIQSYNQVNLDRGHKPIDIRTPREILDDDC
ncbi:MAG: N-6 DNA methylase, partial [Gammaproteobacteria bacterium]|nr:N-6 DNA methylase [Gammaproteobacteria bacterium]